MAITTREHCGLSRLVGVYSVQCKDGSVMRECCLYCTKSLGRIL